MFETIVYASKFSRNFLGFLDHVGPQHILAAFVVDKSVGRVQTLRLVQPFDRLIQIASMLINFALDHVELDQSRCVVDGLVNKLKSLLSLIQVVEMLCQVVKHPEERGGRLLLDLTLLKLADGGQIVRIGEH